MPTRSESASASDADVDAGAAGAGEGDARTEDSESLAGSSIRVVANRTGIAADTLRVWERRYGFPRPLRRPGGSRVYTEDEIARLHLIARAVDAGFRPSEVVALPPADLTRLVEASLADAPRSGHALVSLSPSVGAEASAVTLPTPARSVTLPPTLDAILTALKSDDIVGVRALVRAAAVALGPRMFVTEIAHPLAVTVGKLWADGVLGVRHEHIASACLTSQLHLLLGAVDDGVRAPVVLLATLPGEPHVLGIDMVSVYLAANLAGPRMLGADTPPEQIVEAARAQSVDAVGLSISPVADADRVTVAAKWLLQELPPGVALWLGGAGARRVTDAVPAAVMVSTWTDLDRAIAAARAGMRVR